jgi:hypothetical protein
MTDIAAPTFEGTTRLRWLLRLKKVSYEAR